MDMKKTTGFTLCELIPERGQMPDKIPTTSILDWYKAGDDLWAVVFNVNEYTKAQLTLFPSIQEYSLVTKRFKETPKLVVRGRLINARN